MAASGVRLEPAFSSAALLLMLAASSLQYQASGQLTSTGRPGQLQLASDSLEGLGAPMGGRAARWSLEAQNGTLASGLSGQLRRATQSGGAKKKETRKRLRAECLAAHNKWRRLHGVPELQWDDKIAKFAQKRSDLIAASDGAEFRHPADLVYGENLFWHSSAGQSCQFMVDGWYDEINLYNFKQPSFNHDTGHFTQLVWRATTRLGCATSTSSGPRGGVYLTCNYDPPGNYLGEFEANVPAAGGPKRPVAAGSQTSSTIAPPPTTTLATTTTTTTKPTTTTTTTTTTTKQPATSKPKSKKKGKKNKKGNKNKKASKRRNKKKKSAQENGRPKAATNSSQPAAPISAAT